MDMFKGARGANELLSYEPTQFATHFKPNVDKLGLEYELPYYYPTHFYTFQPIWNKNKIKIEINAWKDLLNIPAEEKGRVIAGDVRNSASQLDAYVGIRTKVDASLFQAYKDKYNPFLVVRIDDQIQKMVSGEANLTNFASNGRPYQWWKQDRSLNWGIANPSEGLTPLPCHMAILAKAKHPNAAKLFVEYITTQQAMQNWVNHELQWPLRNDYGVEGEIAPFMKKADTVAWISLDWSKVTKADREAKRNEFRGIFGG
ncbi:MAG: ABC transporter substrate-binding protein [Chloroflexi bacterium]|nr:ABC transporter substrate-binding protein [Chloroflexota bacterium]